MQDESTGFEANSDGDLMVPIEEPEEPSEQSLEYDDEEPNLVFALMGSRDGQKALKKISDEVYRNFESDFEASTNHRKHVADDLKLATGDLPPKDYPWKNAANAHVPSMLECGSRICSRLESEVFGDYSNVFGVLPTGANGDDIAQALSDHGNWQIREKLTDFPRQMSRGIQNMVFVGDVTCHTYWDPERRCNWNEVLTVDDFITPYVHTTVMPDYSDLPHYTKILRRYRHQLEAMRQVWFDVDKVLDKRKPSFDDEPDDVLRESRAESEEIEKPTEGEAPYKLLQYEGWLTLPGKKRQRWCQVILDHRTRSILLLTIHEEENWQDRLRYDEQNTELRSFMEASAAHAQGTMQIEQTRQQAAMMAPVDRVSAQGLAMQADQNEAQLGPQPMPPAWLQLPEDPLLHEDAINAGPEPVRKDPICMFAHGVAIEPFTGNLGLSMGRILADINRGQDVCLSQFIDASTLANCGMFLTPESMEVDVPMEVGPGKMIKVPGAMPGQLDGYIKALQFQPGNPALLDLVLKFDQMAQSSMQAPDVLSGESGKSGETYRGLMGRIEQATKQISVLGRRFCNFLKQVLKNNARLNSIYLEDEEVFTVLNQSSGEYEEKRAGKALYQRNYSVSILADLRFSTQSQRIAEADELVAMPKAVPALQQNIAFQYITAKKALIARGRQDLIPFLGKEPPRVPVFGMPTPPPPEAIAMGMAGPAGAPGAPQPGGPQPASGGGAPPQGAPPGAPHGTPPGPQAPPGVPAGGIPGPRPQPQPGMQ